MLDNKLEGWQYQVRTLIANPVEAAKLTERWGKGLTMAGRGSILNQFRSYADRVALVHDTFVGGQLVDMMFEFCLDGHLHVNRIVNSTDQVKNWLVATGRLK